VLACARQIVRRKAVHRILCNVKYYTCIKEALPTRTFVAIIVGFQSGVVLSLLAATLIGDKISAGPTLAVAFVALLAGWTNSTYVIRRNAATTSTVLCRGFLLGAAEWLAVIPATRTSPADYQNLPNAVPAVVGEALILFLAAAMAAGCLIAFAVAYFVGRQVSADAPPAPCGAAPNEPTG
jgi:hypothetical protein